MYSKLYITEEWLGKCTKDIALTVEESSHQTRIGSIVPMSVLKKVSQIKKVFVIVLFMVTQVTAIPMIPTYHQLYGKVTLNGEYVTKYTSVSAFVNHTTYTTFTDKGRYGYDPLFFAENGNPNETMYIYVNGRWYDTIIFESEATTQLDIEINESRSYLNDEEAAISYMRTYKRIRENKINSSFDTLIYTTNKTCELDYYEEEDTCRTCFMFNYTLDTEVYTSDSCMSIPPDTTLEEDDNLIKKYIREYIDVNYHVEEVVYVERNITGRVIL
jgi:hypothetical protein